MGNVYTLHSRPVAVTVPGSRNRDESVDVSLLDKALSMDAFVGAPSLLWSETEAVSAEVAVLLSGVLARVAEIIDFAVQGVILKAAPPAWTACQQSVEKRADEKISKQIHGLSFIATDSCEFVIRKCNPMSSIKVRDMEN